MYCESPNIMRYYAVGGFIVLDIRNIVAPLVSKSTSSQLQPILRTAGKYHPTTHG